MARLLIVRGAEMGIEYALDEVTEIGRSSECTIQLLDPSVSRKHARIVRKKGYVIERMSARAEVRINGLRINEATRLVENDEISIGGYVFVFEPELTMVRAKYGDQYVVISPHRPEGMEVGRGGKAELGARSLAVLSGILEHCIYVQDVGECLSKVLEDVVEHFGTERGFVLLFRQESEELVAAVGGEGRMVVSRTVMEKIRKTRKVIVARDAYSDVQLSKGLSLVEGKVRTIVCAPILDGKKVLGFLQVDSTKASGRLPPDAEPLLERVARCLGATISRDARAGEAAEPEIVAGSKEMRKLLGDVDRAAGTSSTCVITGETGTGKEVVAKLIHARSARVGGPFVAVNCAAIPETIIESELFGFEKGSFTGAYRTTKGKIEVADGGTLFLDEIGDMSMYAQAKLLRFLQERVFYRIGAKRYIKVDVRIIAATNRDLASEVRQGRFREDLYYRLAVIPLSVPPLRKRKDDIPVMAELFLEQFCRELKRPHIEISKGMMKRLVDYGWPGNVRELRNMMERFAVLGYEPGGAEAGFRPGRVADAGSEEARIVEALRANRGNKSRTAEDLGISRPTLDKKIKKYGIDIYR